MSCGLRRVVVSSTLRAAVCAAGCGRHVACASQQGDALEVARLQRLDVSQDQFLLGTQGAIASVAWSLSGHRLVRYSSDACFA